MNKANWTELSMHEEDSITTSHKHKKNSSVLFWVADSWAINLGLIPGEVSDLFR